MAELFEGDIVGIAVATYSRYGELTGYRIAVKGQVKRVYQTKIGGWRRADIFWEDKAKGFLYTGNKDWAYCKDLVLISRNGKPAVTRRKPRLKK